MNNEINNVLLDNYERNHILPFLWLKGESKDKIKEYIEKIHSCGIREICIESRPHPAFCEEGYWDDLSFIIEYAKKSDMKLWILDDSHFPTGYANGMIKEKYPERKKQVLIHRELDVVGPQTQAGFRLTNSLNPDEEFLGAIAISKNQKIDISNLVKNGILFFDVPFGNWKICMIYRSRKTDVNEDYINMVDKKSCDVLIEAVYQPHYEHFKDEFGKTIIGFFSDEPGFMNEKGTKNDSMIGKDMPLPYSEELKSRLIDKLGEDWLLQITGLWRNEEDCKRVRHIYMDVATALYRECFDENIATWCKERGVMHIGHIIEDRDSHARLGVGAGHFFRAMAGQDMAGVDIVINQLVPGIDTGTHFYGRGKWDMEFFNYAVAKLGSSLAHIDPKKQGRCMAEVFGAFGWHEGLKLMKWITDHFLVRGINYYVPHAFSMAKFPDWDCPPHFYAHGHNPQFRYFHILMEYMGKMSTLLTGGRAKPSAAILYHAEAEWTGKYMSIQEPARVLTQHQVDFDFIPADVFIEIEKYQTDISKGLCINGNHYQCFILPYAQYIGKEVLEFMKYAETIDFPIYVLNEMPMGLYNSDVILPALANVYVVTLENLYDLMRQHETYEIRTSTYEPYLRYYHYEKGDDSYQMFFNENPKKTIRTKIAGLKGYRINLLNNIIKEFDENLVLEPYESCIITNSDQDKMNVKPISNTTVQSLEIDSCWHLQYANAFSYPIYDEGFTIDKLENLHTSYYPEKAGTFKYSKEIVLDHELASVELEISEAYEIVQVYVDHCDKGICICPPYRFYLSNLTKGTHVLEIEVTNTLDHEQHDYMSLCEVMEPSGLLGNVVLIYEDN